MNATITPTNATSKVKVLRIEIDRAEGPQDKCGKRTFGTWEQANDYLRGVCLEQPKTGTYDKCDFRLVYDDGETYAGRYDAAHPEASAYEGSLGDHVRSHLLFVTGLQKPDWMDQEKYDNVLAGYRKDYPTMIPESERFLKGYALTDDAAPTPTATITPAKESAMTTTAATAPSTTTEKTSKEVRAEHLARRDAEGLPPVAIRGNTFPVRRVLWTLGGNWMEDAKAWMLPAHSAPEGQRITDEVTAKAKAAAKPTPAPVAKPAAPVQTAKPTPAPKAPAKPATTAKPTNAPGKLAPRLEALIKGTTLLMQAAKADGNDQMATALYGALQMIESAR